MSRSSLVQALLVGGGGLLGTLLRWAVSGAVHRAVPFASFPWGTLLVNVLGCLSIGVLAGLAETRQLFGPGTRLFLLIGVLGGFTTFSTFAYETVALIRDSRHLAAAGSVVLHTVVGLTAVWIGLALARP